MACRNHQNPQHAPLALNFHYIEVFKALGRAVFTAVTQRTLMCFGRLGRWLFRGNAVESRSCHLVCVPFPRDIARGSHLPLRDDEVRAARLPTPRACCCGADGARHCTRAWRCCTPARKPTRCTSVPVRRWHRCNAFSLSHTHSLSLSLREKESPPRAPTPHSWHLTWTAAQHAAANPTCR